MRPTRSPIAPKMIAPSGRKAKPTANKASAAISAEVGSSPVKKTLEMTGVSDPKMKKSYHSNAVPADEAVTTRAIDHGLAEVSDCIASSPWRQGIAPRGGGARGVAKAVLRRRPERCAMATVRTIRATLRPAPEHLS